MNNECIVRESLSFFNPNKAKVFERNTDIKKQLVSIDFGNKISVPKESKASLTGNTLCNNTVLGGFLKTNFDSKELQAVTRWFRIVLQKIITPKANLIPYMSSSIEVGLLNKDKVIKILNKADFGISDIIFKDNEYDVNDDLLNALKINSSISQIDLDKIRKAMVKLNPKIYFFNIPLIARIIYYQYMRSQLEQKDIMRLVDY